MSFQTVNDQIEGSEDYSDGYYLGTVAGQQDTTGMGRVQANVPGLFDASAGEVPWVGPLKDSPFGFGVGAKGPYGVFGTPPAGSTVKVELQDGDPHQPLYTNLLTAPAVPPQFANAHVWGFQDPDGNIVIYDLAAHTYKFVTAGGAVINIDANGKRITAVNGDVTNSNGDWQVNVTGNASIQASGNVNFQAGGTATYTATLHQFHGPVVADQTVTSGGDMTDSTDTGNTLSARQFRHLYDIHVHDVPNVQGGGDTRTSLVTPQQA
ncbi:hypothetical protein [Ralstonia phage phiRSL1]|uniref:Baseplate assembly protein n=1 Tax=Ralstonia phage phiRSL1 TaxID=1980924 RepID=B2ZYI1_9CAUD|nr:hypothetical protein RSL1_ORF200 [Ralstonia phage phiRSL1]BAG41649.1 hypothetical protein [Ralstonia phage phiRSL1]